MNRRPVSLFREFCARWFIRIRPLAAASILTAKRAFSGALRRLRRPTRRGILLTLAAVPALFLLYVLALVPSTPALGDIRKARIDRPAIIVSADGRVLDEFKPVNREWVSLRQISPYVLDALIATEDHRFYEHHGIDWLRMAAAALHTLSGERQGGSTITQQLARNLYPDQVGRAPTLARKVREAITALKIEAVYSKDQVLETYLNNVPFLYNAYGVEMAARTYFGKSAQQLDILEGATLVGMLKANSTYNPVLNPSRAVQRRNTVLGQMSKHGKLRPNAHIWLSRQPLRVNFAVQPAPRSAAPHFSVQLRKWLIAWAERNGYNIYADGLVVRTTIDFRLQAMALQAVDWQASQLQWIANEAWSERRGCGPDNDLFRTFMRQTPEYRTARDAGRSDETALRRLGRNPAFVRDLCRSKTQVQAGFIAIDPRNGDIKAWVGSRDFTDAPFDHVQQARRQPGSTFKPFVYGAAFADGARPDDTLVDRSVAIPLRGQAMWRPSDAEPPTGRPVTLRDALVYSRNRVTAQLMQETRPEKVARLAHAMGVRESALERVPSLALGTSPVTLKEMVSAYSTIANRGAYVEPRMVTRIEDHEGKVLAEFKSASPEQALPAGAAQTLVDVMRDVVVRGTGAQIRTRFGIRADVAGKTGTTQDNADGWFILMHPQLVAGAWVGFDDGRVTLGDYWGQGARSALPMVGAFYDMALRARAVDPEARFSPETRASRKVHTPRHRRFLFWGD
ncbi:transglycosylase domain-containing protein [Cupriavidus sp. IK-TO18]|uniref:penicillin-binding protein 1A n=1 Tax=Cupriavidus sp. IK-TO18 TaxID=2782182 RepID=UPI0018971F53|nr:transglycosylase domain-containing protein [Cupriavidus sp. IK-TO18]